MSRITGSAYSHAFEHMQDDYAPLNSADVSLSSAKGIRGFTYLYRNHRGNGVIGTCTARSHCGADERYIVSIDSNKLQYPSIQSSHLSIQEDVELGSPITD